MGMGPVSTMRHASYAYVPNPGRHLYCVAENMTSAADFVACTTSLSSQKHNAVFMSAICSQQRLARLLVASRNGKRAQPSSRMFAYAETRHSSCDSCLVSYSRSITPNVLPTNGGNGARMIGGVTTDGGGGGGGGGGDLATNGKHCQPPTIVVPHTDSDAENIAKKLLGNSLRSSCTILSSEQKHFSAFNDVRAAQHDALTRVARGEFALSPIEAHPPWINRTRPSTEQAARIGAGTIDGEIIADGAGGDAAEGGERVNGGSAAQLLPNFNFRSHACSACRTNGNTSRRIPSSTWPRLTLQKQSFSSSALKLAQQVSWLKFSEAVHTSTSERSLSPAHSDTNVSSACALTPRTASPVTTPTIITRITLCRSLT